MSQPVASKFSELIIKIGDGASPETFTKVGIAMVSRSWNQTGQTVSRTTPDEDNEDLVVYEDKEPSTRSAAASGKGKIDKSKVAALQAKLMVKGNYEIVETGVGTWMGPFILTQFNRTGERANTWDCDITLEASGALIFTPSGS